MFEIDGISVVLAPDSVVLQASKAWKDHIIAHFHDRCLSPSKIYDDLNPVWGKHGNITVRTLSQTAALIFVSSATSREWVLQVGYWQVDNCALTVLPWSAEALLELQELITAPIWEVLKNVPPQVYSLNGISVIASGIGEPLHTENSRLESFHFGDTKVKVEIKLQALPPLAVIVRDTHGHSVRINVEYPHLPPKCCNCGKFGHMLKYCTIPIQRKIFKNHQSAPRMTSDTARVTVSDEELAPIDETPDGSVAKDLGSIVPVTNAASSQALSQTVVERMSVEVSLSDLSLLVSPKHKPAKFLTHGKEKKLKLRVQSELDQRLVSEKQITHSLQSSEQHDLPPDIALEEGEIPFIPSTAARKKARRLQRQEALLAAASPTSAVSYLFSSIRGKSLGRGARRA